MRELKEEEMSLVHGGTANISGRPINWNVGNYPGAAGVETMLGHEFRALNKLQVHTLMDQMSNDS